MVGHERKPQTLVSKLLVACMCMKPKNSYPCHVWFNRHITGDWLEGRLIPVHLRAWQAYTSCLQVDLQSPVGCVRRLFKNAVDFVSCWPCPASPGWYRPPTQGEYLVTSGNEVPLAIATIHVRYTRSFVQQVAVGCSWKTEKRHMLPTPPPKN